MGIDQSCPRNYDDLTVRKPSNTGMLQPQFVIPWRESRSRWPPSCGKQAVQTDCTAMEGRAEL